MRTGPKISSCATRFGRRTVRWLQTIRDRPRNRPRRFRGIPRNQTRRFTFLTSTFSCRLLNTFRTIEVAGLGERPLRSGAVADVRRVPVRWGLVRVVAAVLAHFFVQRGSQDGFGELFEQTVRPVTATGPTLRQPDQLGRRGGGFRGRRLDLLLSHVFHCRHLGTSLAEHSLSLSGQNTDYRTVLLGEPGHRHGRVRSKLQHRHPLPKSTGQGIRAEFCFHA